jgi:hypothetical protein
MKKTFFIGLYILLGFSAFAQSRLTPKSPTAPALKVVPKPAPKNEPPAKTAPAPKTALPSTPKGFSAPAPRPALTTKPALNTAPAPKITSTAPYTIDCSGSTITLHDIQVARIPYNALKDESLNPFCKAEVKRRIAAFEEEDKKKWDKLSEQYCAFRTHQPTKAAKSWNRQRQDVYARREKALQSLSCDCRGAEIDQQQTAKLRSHHINPAKSKAGGNDFVLHCLDGKCPDGYRCDHGVCKENNPLFKSGIKDWQTKAPADKDAGIDFFRSSAAELYAHLTTDSLIKYRGKTRQAEGEEYDNWKEAYYNTLTDLRGKITIYYTLLQEYNRAAETTPGTQGRSTRAILTDLQQAHADMEKMFRNINIAYSELMTTRNPSPTACTSAFTAWHKWYCYYVVKILNVRPGN